MYRDTSSVDCAPRELTHACSVTPKLVICVMYLTSIGRILLMTDGLNAV